MTALPREDHLCKEAAEGWLGLGNWREAELEWARISADGKSHPLVLEVRYKICGASGQWAEAAEAAETIRRRLPGQPWGHFHLAYALHEMGRTREACQTLQLVVDQFPGDWMMRFNLACYACRLGNLKEAMSWLAKAMALTERKEIRSMALEDKDLEPLWGKIREI
jgi:predicted Zn-dependent protease